MRSSMTFLRDHQAYIRYPIKSHFAHACAILYPGLGQAPPVKSPLRRLNDFCTNGEGGEDTLRAAICNFCDFAIPEALYKKDPYRYNDIYTKTGSGDVSNIHDATLAYCAKV